jgi:hypothetical protein
MADDQQLLIGKWTVKVKDWIWEYDFSTDGKIAWRDTRSNEKGVGHWTMTSQLVNLSWQGSSTIESWQRPLKPDHTGWYQASYYVGNYKVQKVIPRGATDVDPSVANLPLDRYIDCFTEVKYDINWEVPRDRGAFADSPFLQVTYADGARLVLDIEKDFSNEPMSYDQIRDQIAHAKLGRGNRICPDILNKGTVPRLWAAREEAFAKQEENAQAFMGIAITGTALVLSFPAMPAGPMPAGTSVPKPVKRPTAGTSVPPAPIQSNQVRLGPGNMPGSLWARIMQTAEGVIYEVNMIFLSGGKGPAVATARATHREMIRRAAQMAQSSGQKTFKMVGKQANPNFVRHADQLAKEIGVAGSGVQGRPSAGFPDYTVVLDVAKTLASP